MQLVKEITSALVSASYADTASTIDVSETLKVVEIPEMIPTEIPGISPTVTSSTELTDREFKFQEPIPPVEVIRERVSKQPKDIALELKLEPKIISLREDVLSPFGKNLFARKTGEGEIEIFEVIE